MRHGFQMKNFWISILTCALILVFSIPPVQAANEIVVFFPSTDFILGSTSYDMNFTATIENISTFSGSEGQLTMQIIHVTNPSLKVECTAKLLSQGVYGFSGTLPLNTGTYNITYHYKGASINSSPNTPKQLKIHYRAAASVNPSVPQLRDSNVEISGWIYDKSDNAVTAALPHITVEGATIYSNSITNGFFTLKLSQITASGKDALKLLFDGVEVASWDVSAGPFASLSVSPGALMVDVAQGITIVAMSNDQGSSGGVTSNLRLIDNSSLTVELTGVPISASSVTRYDASASDYTETYYRDTFKKLTMSGYDLSYNQLQFTEAGTLQLKISANDGRFTSVVVLPVEYGDSTGLFGAPAWQSYAGDTELSLQFDTSNNQQVSEYFASISINDEEPVTVSEKSSSGYLYRVKPVVFGANGTGKAAVTVTTTSSNAEQREWKREFTYVRPSLELSQNLIQLGEDVSLSIFLRDAEGNTIKNGWVTIDGIGGRSANSNGEYVFRTTWNQGGYRRIQAFTAEGSLVADFSKLLKVQVPEVLTVVPDTEVLMAGASQTLKAKVLDENGRELSGARITAFVDNATTPSYFSWNGKEYSLTLSAMNSVVLQAESSDSRKASPSVEITVAKPVVSCNVSALTANFMQHVEFTITHPLTNAALSGTIALRTQNVQIAERNVSSNGSSSSSSANKTGTRISMDLYNRPLSGSSEPKVIVDFTYLGRTYSEILSLPVGQPVLSVSPEELRQGVTEKLTLTVKSAAYEAMAGLKVKLQGSTTSAEGTTNESGQVSFSIKPSANATQYTFIIERTDQYVQTGSTPTTIEISVPVIGDTTPPTLQISNLGEVNYADTDQDTYVLDFDLSDDFALDALVINGQRYDLEGAEIRRSETVKLTEGDNAITIVLLDKAGHQVSRDISIYYEKPEQPDPATQPIVLTIGSYVVKQGDITLVRPPQVPQLMGGRSMLPFRYLVETVLKGMVNYEADTRKITAYVNGHEIVMTVDDNVIFVDGLQVSLDQAPVVQDGSTLAPLRAFEKAVSSLVWDGLTQSVTVYP